MLLDTNTDRGSYLSAMAPFGKTPPSTPSSSSRAPAAAPAVDDFSARRSARVSARAYAPDGDTWVEALAVCEIPVRPGYGDDGAAAASSRRPRGGGLFRKFKSKKDVGRDGEEDAGGAADPSGGEADVAAASQRLTLRPYFQSQNTGNRVWDEPPSGASEILYATPEARRMARAQLEEMKSTYAAAAVKRRKEREERKAAEEATAGRSRSGSGIGTGSKLIPKSFRRAASASAASDGQSSSLLGSHKKSGGRIKGSLMLSDEGGRKGIPNSILQESKELAGVDAAEEKRRAKELKSSYERDLQQAMLMSMGVGGGSVMGVGDHRPQSRGSAAAAGGTGNGLTREEEEQLELAKALSVSEQEARQGRSTRRGKGSSGSSSSSKDGSKNSRGSGRSKGNGSSGRQRRSKSHKSPPQSDSMPSVPYTSMKPPPAATDEFDQNFDGGGKMPAKATATSRSKNKANNNEYNGPNVGDFGDRGPSWELSWSKSGGSPMNKDWALS